MIVAVALLLQQAVGQPLSSVTVRNGDKATTVSVSLIDRGPVVQADALAAALAGQIETRSHDEYIVAVAGVRVAVTAGVPFVRVGDQTLPLLAEPVVRGGTLYLPYSFVSDFLPRVAAGVTFDTQRGVLQRQLAASPPSPGKARGLTVVVDAGHGGPDRGMRGPIGADWEIREKDITLDVSLALRERQERRRVPVDPRECRQSELEAARCGARLRDLLSVGSQDGGCTARG